MQIDSFFTESNSGVLKHAPMQMGVTDPHLEWLDKRVNELLHNSGKES